MLLDFLTHGVVGAVLGALVVGLWLLWRFVLWALDRAFEGVIK